jgi:hypothetical protein
MQVEHFDSMLQDSLTSLEQYFTLLIDNTYKGSLVQNVRNYVSSVKKNITDQYNTLNKEIQLGLKNKFKEFIEKCDGLLKTASDKALHNQNILSLSNDVFYNDMSFQGGYYQR